MNSTSWRNCLALFVLTSLLAGCGGQKKEEPKEASSEKASEAESRVKHGTNGELIVTVEVKIQQSIGLQTTPLAPVQLSPQVKAYGRVLDVSPLASLLAEMTAAEAASQTSQAELKRVKTLAAQNNASERALQAAQAAAAHEQAQIQSVRLRLLAGWGGAISQRQDLPDFVQSLATLTTALVQLDLPAGEVLPATPTSACLFTLGDQTKPIAAEWLGHSSTADPQMQGQRFLFLVLSNSSGLVPGTSVSGFLNLPGEPRAGVSLPRSAIVRFNGATWVYLQIQDEQFQRQKVTLEEPLESGWFVASGLKPQDKVVTIGGQQLLSEELKGQGE